MDVVCPLCLSPTVRKQPISDTVIVCGCDQCGTVFTIQLNALGRTIATPSRALTAA